MKKRTRLGAMILAAGMVAMIGGLTGCSIQGASQGFLWSISEDIMDEGLDVFMEIFEDIFGGYGGPGGYGPVDDKPVLYLYPEESCDVSVTLDFDGELTCTYPKCEQDDSCHSSGTWNVTAHPDGTLINQADGRVYSYIFWEGISNQTFEFDEGYVVAGEDTEAFLQEYLEKMGLEPKEYNEFIVYWLPKMEHNPYNLISFIGDDYDASAPLIIDPKPDSVLRVFMIFRALESKEEITISEPEAPKPFERSGFTVVEWGGSEY